ncbi:winged helix-turn-helix domain-containing protein [Kitasatospora paranensis]|uniref:Winged helix-turn-helix domain-containing protein n=1 Tax=Kitasatospora paranensis TaxID=258053 RepID=A0ABW2G2Z5_9ACTN
MSSVSTATRTVPVNATPHLRAVRTAAAPGTADRRHVPAQVRPTALQALPPQPAAPVLPAGLPEGATVVALPQSALPPGLLDRYGARLGGSAGHPLVGYLLLVPAEQARPARTDSLIAAAAPVTPAAAAPAAGDGPRPPLRPSAHGISVDVDRRSAHVDGRLLDLTYLEFELLAHLTEHPHRVHTRDHLVSAVWGYGHVGDGRTVDVHVARLRRKLGAAYRDSIVTVRRVGYKYAPVA